MHFTAYSLSKIKKPNSLFIYDVLFIPQIKIKAKKKP